jgi:hypothetical protein
MGQKLKTVAALKAAQDVYKDKLTTAAAGERYDVEKSSVTDAIVILTYGTTEEKLLAWEGNIPIRKISGPIRRRMSPEEVKAFGFKRRTEMRRDYAPIPGEIEVYHKLGPALVAMTELPDAAQTVKLLKRNPMRTKVIDARLEIAFKWLTEFTNEWRRAKNVQPKVNTTDTGGSDPVVGTQHTEPTTE